MEKTMKKFLTVLAITIILGGCSMERHMNQRWDHCRTHSQHRDEFSCAWDGLYNFFTWAEHDARGNIR